MLCYDKLKNDLNRSRLTIEILFGKMLNNAAIRKQLQTMHLKSLCYKISNIIFMQLDETIICVKHYLKYFVKDFNFLCEKQKKKVKISIFFKLCLSRRDVRCPLI